MIITIQTYGAFRKFGAMIELDIPSGVTIGIIKQKLALRLGSAEQELVRVSVLASATEILADNALYQDGQKLAILPPVCGG